VLMPLCDFSVFFAVVGGSTKYAIFRDCLHCISENPSGMLTVIRRLVWV